MVSAFAVCAIEHYGQYEGRKKIRLWDTHNLFWVFAPITCKRARYPSVYKDFLNGISIGPLYKGVGHRDSTLMRNPGRPESLAFSLPPSPAR